MSTRDGSDQELKLLTVSMICPPLTAQPIDTCVSQYQHLADLELADPMSEEATMEVDLLMGLNYYWKFTTGESH